MRVERRETKGGLREMDRHRWKAGTGKVRRKKIEKSQEHRRRRSAGTA